MGNLVGIDLGTTFSVISILDNLGRPELIPIDSERITPSVVYFGTDNVLVGKGAKNKLTDVDEAYRVIKNAKRDMGTSKVYTIDGNEYTPVQISSFILKKIISEASEYKGQIDEAVITVPSHFNENERNDTINAGKLAGIDVKYIINEPTAATLYFSSLNPIAGNVLVYDLGGGTFDVTIARVSSNDVEVITSVGDKHLGGTDFDKCILRIFEQRYHDKFGVNLIDNGNEEEFLNKAEELKRNLSNPKHDSQIIKLKGHAGNIETTITLKEYESSISQYIVKTELLIDSALQEAGYTYSDINHILLVGGSTRTPLVSKTLKRMFNKDPLKVLNPDEAVSLGASIYAGLKADKNKLTVAQANSINKLKLQEVCNDYYGTIYLNYNESMGLVERRNFIMLDKNTQLPCSNKHIFETVHDGQTSIRCAVTQSKSEEKDPQFVEVIWEGHLEGLPPNRPAGQPIEITFSYDQNQLMHCSYKDVNSGKELEVNLHPQESENLALQKEILNSILIE